MRISPLLGMGKVSDPPAMAVHRVFTLGGFGRFLAVGYLRSVDPVALFIQRLAGMVGLRSIEHQAWEFRVYWRQLV